MALLLHLEEEDLDPVEEEEEMETVQEPLSLVTCSSTMLHNSHLTRDLLQVFQHQK
ncbi:UNVERIFIED_CONTAM: hypothetical protein GTU68_003620 [Idotea baltica]|nr:hypothetical protein [Idotea baltica]